LKHVDYVQAITYRHELSKFINKPIRVLIIGGSVSDDFPLKSIEENVKATSFADIISTARRELEWKLRVAD